MTRRIITAAVAGALIAGTALVAAPGASAKHGNDDGTSSSSSDDSSSSSSSSKNQKSRGSCNTSSRWEAEAESEHGSITVAFKVETGETGQPWRYVLKHDTVRVYASTRSTTASSDDSFPAKVKWTTTRTDRAGVDRFVLRAVNTQTGEICRTVVSI